MECRGFGGFRRSGGREGYVDIKSLGKGFCNRRYGDMKGIPCMLLDLCEYGCGGLLFDVV